MKLEDIKTLRLQVIKNKVLYEETIKLYNAECMKRYKENNLSVDNDNDIEKIVDIDMELSEKYGTDNLHKAYAETSNNFILAAIQWLADNPPPNTDSSKIKVLTDLIDMIKNDKNLLIIHRVGLLDLCLRAEAFMEAKT